MSERVLVEGVARGAFPAAIVEETTAKFWARRLGLSLNIGPVTDIGELRLRFRNPPRSVLERVNVSIGRALRYGAIDAIRRRYIVEAAEAALSTSP